MNWKVLVLGAVPVVSLVAILALNIERKPRFVSDNLEGDCPRLEGEFQTIDGQSISLEELRGVPLVLNFWSTTCISCKYEHNDLVETRRLYEARGVQFYGVMWHDTVVRAKAWLKKNDAAFPILVDPGDRLAIELGVMATPETFVINTDGCVNKKFTGPVTVDLLASELEPLL
jgi:cytochrome c biogenesis protein CcmG/thiol:disulfide interchange protein DsbE